MKHRIERAPTRAELRQKITEIDRVSQTAKRIGVRPSVVVHRYSNNLRLLQSWLTKLRWAETKVRKYQSLCRRYEKHFQKKGGK